MAISLSKFEAYGEYNTDTVFQRGIQCLKFILTATAADVTYDIDDFTGTFWGDVSASVAGAGAKDWMRSHYQGVQSLVSVQSEFTENYLRGAAVGAGVYTQSITSHLPDIRFNAAEGPTSMVLILKFTMADGTVPLTANFG